MLFRSGNAKSGDGIPTEDEIAQCIDGLIGSMFGMGRLDNFNGDYHCGTGGIDIYIEDVEGQLEYGIRFVDESVRYRDSKNFIVSDKKKVKK